MTKSLTTHSLAYSLAHSNAHSLTQTLPHLNTQINPQKGPLSRKIFAKAVAGEGVWRRDEDFDDAIAADRSTEASAAAGAAVSDEAFPIRCAKEVHIGFARTTVSHSFSQFVSE